jgi:hypothetical protein
MFGLARQRRGSARCFAARNKKSVAGVGSFRSAAMARRRRQAAIGNDQIARALREMSRSGRARAEDVVSARRVDACLALLKDGRRPKPRRR